MNLLRSCLRRRMAFTLIEIMVTIIILSAVASVSIPMFMKTHELNLCRRARQHLFIIRGKLAIVETQDGVVPVADVNTTAEVNTLFELEIDDDAFSYGYEAPTAVMLWEVSSVRSGGGYAPYTFKIDNAGEDVNCEGDGCAKLGIGAIFNE